MHEAKKLLLSFSNEQIEKLLNKTTLTELEYWVVKYGIIQKRMVENTCMKLNISRSTYRNIYNIALTKINNTVNNLLA